MKTAMNFNIFLRDNKSKLSSRYPFLTQDQIMSKLRQQWRKLNDSSQHVPKKKDVDNMTEHVLFKPTKFKVSGESKKKQSKKKTKLKELHFTSEEKAKGQSENPGIYDFVDSGYESPNFRKDEAEIDSPYLQAKEALDALNDWSKEPVTLKDEEHTKLIPSFTIFKGKNYLPGGIYSTPKVQHDVIGCKTAGILKPLKKRNQKESHARVCFENHQERGSANHKDEFEDFDFDEEKLHIERYTSRRFQNKAAKSENDNHSQASHLLPTLSPSTTGQEKPGQLSCQKMERESRSNPKKKHPTKVDTELKVGTPTRFSKRLQQKTPTRNTTMEFSGKAGRAASFSKNNLKRNAIENKGETPQRRLRLNSAQEKGNLHLKLAKGDKSKPNKGGRNDFWGDGTEDSSKVGQAKNPRQKGKSKKKYADKNQKDFRKPSVAKQLFQTSEPGEETHTKISKPEEPEQIPRCEKQENVCDAKSTTENDVASAVDEIGAIDHCICSDDEDAVLLTRQDSLSENEDLADEDTVLTTLDLREKKTTPKPVSACTLSHSSKEPRLSRQKNLTKRTCRDSENYPTVTRESKSESQNLKKKRNDPKSKKSTPEANIFGKQEPVQNNKPLAQRSTRNARQTTSMSHFERTAMESTKETNAEFDDGCWEVESLTNDDVDMFYDDEEEEESGAFCSQVATETNAALLYALMKLKATGSSPEMNFEADDKQSSLNVSSPESQTTIPEPPPEVAPSKRPRGRGGKRQEDCDWSFLADPQTSPEDAKDSAPLNKEDRIPLKPKTENGEDNEESLFKVPLGVMFQDPSLEVARSDVNMTPGKRRLISSAVAATPSNFGSLFDAEDIFL